MSVVRIKGLTGLQDTKDQVQELTHHRADDTHFGLTCPKQSIGKGFQDRIVLLGDNGGEE